MDINELIDNLRMPSWHDLEDPDATLLGDAADALFTIQAENEKLRNSRDRWRKCAEEFSAGVNQRDNETEKLQAENEKLKRALAEMWFAYVNKDGEIPHTYEEEAVELVMERLEALESDARGTI